MEIRYDATDWKQQYDSSPMRPTSMDEAIELMRESNVKPGELAMLLIVGRELGIVKDPNVPTNKISNLTGMGLAVSRYRSRQTANVQIAGKPTTVQRYVSTVTVEEAEEVNYQATTPNMATQALATAKPTPDVLSDVTIVDYNTHVATDRAIAYLMTNVVGRIRQRLQIVALNRPKEVAAVVKELKRAIDEIAKELK